MKTAKIIFALMAILVLICPNTQAQTGLYIEYTLQSPKAKGTNTMYLTESASRTESEMKMPEMPNYGIKVVTIVYTKNLDEVYMVDEKNKSYSIIAPDNTHHKSNYQIKPLADEQVAGYPCKHFYITEGKESSEVWTTKSVPNYQKFKNAYGAVGKYDDGFWQAMEKAGVEGIPVKMVYTEASSKEKITMTLQKLETKPIPDAKFSLTGYKQTKNPSIPGMPEGFDPESIQKMTPEQQQKMMEQLQKQFGGE